MALRALFLFLHCLLLHSVAGRMGRCRWMSSLVLGVCPTVARVRSAALMKSTFSVGPVRPTSPSLMLRLRHETRPEHAEVEAVVDLVSPHLTREVYRKRLEQFYGFYLPLEERLAERLAERPHAGEEWGRWGLDLNARRKVPLLEADLRVLGTAPDRLPRCADLPPLPSLAAVFGCLYVLEGATLGGQVISRHVRGRLGIYPENGGRFFAGYGPEVGARWREFGGALERYAVAPHLQEAVIQSARATFVAFTDWFRRGTQS